MLQLDQKLDEKWPLTVIDHANKKKKIYLKPGEMIMLESSKVPHGRQFPLKGDHVDQVVLFFQPKEPEKETEYYDD